VLRRPVLRRKNQTGRGRPDALGADASGRAAWDDAIGIHRIAHVLQNLLVQAVKVVSLGAVGKLREVSEPSTAGLVVRMGGNGVKAAAAPRRAAQQAADG
jgi:hypothetical protein